MANFMNEIENHFGIISLLGASFTMTVNAPCQSSDRSNFLKVLYEIKRSKGVRRAYLKFRKDKILLKVIFTKGQKNDRTTI